MPGIELVAYMSARNPPTTCVIATGVDIYGKGPLRHGRHPGTSTRSGVNPLANTRVGTLVARVCSQRMHNLG